MVGMTCSAIDSILHTSDFNDLIHRQKKAIACIRKGEQIVWDSQQLIFLRRGILQLQCHGWEQGVTVLGWLQDNSLLFSAMTRLTTLEAIALTDCFYQKFSLGELQTVPGFQAKLLDQLLKQQQQTEYLLAIAGLKRIEDRLATLLHLLQQDLGKEDNHKIRLRCRFTHQNLADTIGSTRVTVTRCMKEFQAQGWLSLDDNRHLLIDPNYKPAPLI